MSMFYFLANSWGKMDLFDSCSFRMAYLLQV